MEQSNTLDTIPDSSSSDPIADEIRVAINEWVEPKLHEDLPMAGMLIPMFRRYLKSASLQDLQNTATMVVDLARKVEKYAVASGPIIETVGQSDDSRIEREREIDSSEVPIDELATEVLPSVDPVPETGETTDSGYEATLESDGSSDGKDNTEPIQGIRTGRRNTKQRNTRQS